jgi:hypothetical protein
MSSEDIVSDDILSDAIAPMALSMESTAAICALESIAVKSVQVMSSADIWANAGAISTPESMVIASKVLMFVSV